MSDNFDLTYKLLFRKYYANLLFYATRIGVMKKRRT